MAINFFWDDLEDNILEEYDDAGVTVADYTTEPDLYGNVISQRRGSQSTFFHYDALGSTLAATDESQSVNVSRAYTAFGECTESSGSTVTPVLFVGSNGYRSVGLDSSISVRERDYRPALGRWLSADPVGAFTHIRRHVRCDSCRVRITDGSPYLYVANRPTWVVDPSGLEFPCKDDEIAVPRKGFEPVVNGCTGVPDCPEGGADFKGACDQHDRCYQTCKKSKKECDDAFLKDLKSACIAVKDYPTPITSEDVLCLGPGYPYEVLVPPGQCLGYTFESCMVGAQGYYDGVTFYFRKKAQELYEDSQKKACACVKKALPP